MVRTGYGEGLYWLSPRITLIWTATHPSTSPVQQASRVFREIGQDEVRSSPFDREERFHHGSGFVQPSRPTRGPDHAVFAAYLVGRDGQIDARARRGDDIQIRQGRLDHDDVRPLLHIQIDLSHRF